MLKEREQLENALVDVGAEPALPGSSGSKAEGGGPDFTTLPTELDARLEAEDADGAVRPTIINVGKTWKKREQRSLLAGATERWLGVGEQKLEKNTCWDLLDALTRSGGLAMEQGQLHVVVASTHCFEKSLMDTLVKDNVNPIEKLEHTSSIVASVVHGVEIASLLNNNNNK